MFEKKHKRIISVICILLSLSSIALTFSGCDTNSDEEVLGTFWSERQIVINGYEYVSTKSYGTDGMWEVDPDTDEMNKIGKIRMALGYGYVWASNEAPPICLYISKNSLYYYYVLKSYTLPSKLSASFSSIDFGRNVFFDFDKAVSMKDIVSLEETIIGDDHRYRWLDIHIILFDKAVSMRDIVEAIIGDEDCEMEWIDSADLYYSEHDMIYLRVGIYRINEEFYIRLDDVYYPIVMPEILDYLKTKYTGDGSVCSD